MTLRNVKLIYYYSDLEYYGDNEYELVKIYVDDEEVCEWPNQDEEGYNFVEGFLTALHYIYGEDNIILSTEKKEYDDEDESEN